MEARNGDKKDSRLIVVNEDSEKDRLAAAIRSNLEKSVYGQQKKEEGFHIANVMEAILRGMELTEYMEKAGCCMCERCQADVLALSLTRLPSKYVVVYNNETNPTISYYRDRYRMDIITAIVRAVEDVKKHPHHRGEGNR